MADMVTKQELANAKIDAKDLGDAINEKKTVTPRYGTPFKTVPLVIEELNTKANEVITQGFYKGFATEALLLAAKPTVSEMRARADDTRKIWRWNRTSAEGVVPVTGAWIDTGLSDKDIAAADATAKANTAELNAKSYVELNTNLNLFRGITAYIPQYNAVSFDKTTLKADYAPTEIRYRGMNVTGGFIVPFNGELRNKLQVWARVKSAALNAGTSMRFLIQAVKQDNTNFLSVYGNIADGATGWIKLGETTLSEANRALFKHVNIQPHVTGGAELVVDDFYIGEGTPANPFVRVNEPKNITIARTAERRSVLPHWSKYPISATTTVNENGDVSLAPNSSYVITMPVADASRLYYCANIDQVNTGDCRFFWRGYRKGLSTFQDVPFFPCATLGNEFSASVGFDSLISSVQLTISNYSTTDFITLRSFDICYDSVAVNGKIKIGDRLDLSKVKSDIIQSITSGKPYQNYSTFPNFEVVAKSADGKRYAVSGVVFGESVENGGIKKGVTYYVSLPDAVATLGTGTAKLTLFHSNSAGGSLGGATRDFAANGGVLNSALTTTADTANLQIRIDTTGGATVQLGRIIISEVPYSSDVVFQDYYVEDKTGTLISDWAYPKLSGYTKLGLVVNHPIAYEDGDPVLTIPNTAATGYGQGVRWIVDLQQGAINSTMISFLAKLSYTGTNPTGLWIRYFREGSITEIGASFAPFTVNKDGSWTLNRIFIPSKYSGYDVKYIEISFYINSTATSPLQLKRFIQTTGIHNPLVKFIKTVGADSVATGLSDFLRLKDALAEQPQNVFSVGRQLFRPLKTVQESVSDYELINGQSLLPKRLNNLRHIDTDGYLIAFLDRDDTVYLRKGAALYKTTVEDLNSRCIASSTVESEKRGVFNSSGLTLINANVPSGFLRVTGDGTLVIVSRASASYSTDGGVTWITATGYQDTNGEHYNAWGTDCVDNVVITSGYKIATEGRGTGRVNYSSDNGKTYQVILDIETSEFIDNALRGSMHIHSVKYDPYWSGVWVIMGDGAFNNPGSAVTSNIWFIDNPGTPEQAMISYDCRGQDWLNEQHVSIFPLQDCLLLGSDANPTALYRMARTKNPNALRDVAMPISTALSHYGCGGYQHAPHLPATVYFGKASEYVGNLNDVVLLTYDGVNVVEIYKEPETSNTPSGKVNTFAFALDNYFIFERRTDARFASGNCWVVGDIRYMR